MRKCLMLDVDGVVVTGRQADGKRWDTDLQRDLGLAPEDLTKYFFKVYWPDIVVGKQPIKPCLQEALEACNSQVSANDVMAYWFAHDARIDTDVLGQVADIRASGVKVVLATNQEHARAGYLMNTLGLRDLVDGICYSAQIGAAKPAPAFFAAAQEQAGCAPSDMLLIDDTEANVVAARQSGWHAALWTGDAPIKTLLQMG